jgi:hypothetical protein
VKGSKSSKYKFFAWSVVKTGLSPKNIFVNDPSYGTLSSKTFKSHPASFLRLLCGFCEIYLHSRVHKFHKFATIFPFSSLSRAAFKKCLLKNRQAKD